MSLDDRSLREHLGRRATAGLTNPDDLADAVISRLPSDTRVGWSRPFARSTQSLGLAAAAVVAVVVAIAVLPPRAPGPGTSPSPSDQSARSQYPADRPLTLAELDAVLGPDPMLRASVTLIADVELRVQSELSCLIGAECPRYLIDFGHREIFVYEPPGGGPLVPGPQAFRVRDEPAGRLDLIGPMKPGPDGIAWTLPKLLEVVPEARANDRAIQYLYLVDAVRAISELVYRCLPVVEGDPNFGCGGGVAWLVVNEGAVPTDWSTAPADSLRVPNVVGGRLRAGPQRGFWLVNPVINADVSCFLCPPAGSADLLARALTFDELGFRMPSSQPTLSASPALPASPTSGISPIGVNGLTFSTTSMTLDGFETADVKVRVHFTGDIQDDFAEDMGLAPTPYVCLERTTPSQVSHWGSLVRELVRIPGTDTFETTFRLTAGDAGEWVASCLVAYTAGDYTKFSIDPRERSMSPSLQIVGTHAPGLTMTFDPRPATIGSPVTVTGRAFDEQTGAGLAGVEISFARDSICAEGGGAAIVVTTGPDGAYAIVIDEADEYPACAAILSPSGLFPMNTDTALVAVYARLFGHPTDP